MRAEHKLRFSTVLSSDLPGAVFIAKIVARWPRAGGQPAPAAIRSALRVTADTVTATYPVDRRDAAEDAVRIELQAGRVKLAEDEFVAVEAEVNLSVDARSSTLQRERRDAARTRQAQFEGARDDVQHLRRKLLTDAANTRLWAVRHQPELVTVQDGEFLNQLIGELAAGEKPDLSDNAHSRALAEFVSWLTGTDGGDKTNLNLLDDLLRNQFRETKAADLVQILAGSAKRLDEGDAHGPSAAG